MVESLEEVKASLAEDRTAQGASITLSGGKIQYDMVLQGYESDKVRNLLEEVLKLELLKEDPSFDPGTAVRTLEENSERLSDRISYMPILLLLNSAFMGLFIVAAYIFMDKEEGTIRALTVTPVSIRDYLLAKSGVMLFTGLLTGLLTTVGLFIASFYDSVIKAMGALYVAIMILAFGAVSYFMPSFSPFFMRVLPSYPLLFAFREVFLKDADTGFVLQNSLLFLGIGILVFLVSVKRYQKTITV
jgi:ABC-type Na+ efflux pump permease subunit